MHHPNCCHQAENQGDNTNFGCSLVDPNQRLKSKGSKPSNEWATRFFTHRPRKHMAASEKIRKLPTLQVPKNRKVRSQATVAFQFAHHGDLLQIASHLAASSVRLESRRGKRAQQRRRLSFSSWILTIPSFMLRSRRFPSKKQKSGTQRRLTANLVRHIHVRED